MVCLFNLIFFSLYFSHYDVRGFSSVSRKFNVKYTKYIKIFNILNFRS